MTRAYYNEIDPFAAQWLRNLIGRGLIADGDVDERSIADIQPDELAGYRQCHFFAGIGGWSYALELAGWPDDRPVWTGSCPCQPFSDAGKGLGTDDPRHLWPDFYRLIKECNPAIVFGEQVADPKWIDIVSDDLEASAYAVWPCVFRACSVGADHDRPRFYFAASDAACERPPKPWQCWKNPICYAADAFGEADRLVDAVRRKTLPFLCRGHDGVSGKLGGGACKALGNAIVPEQAAQFIRASVEAIGDMTRAVS